MIVAVVQGSDVMRPAGLSAADYYRSLTDLQSTAWNSTLRLTTVLCCYAAVYLGISTAIGRWGRLASSDVRAAHIRVLTILIVTGGIIFPLILRTSDSARRQSFTLYDITSPHYVWLELIKKEPTRRVEFDWSSPRESLQELTRARGHVDVIVVLLLFAAFIAVAVNSLALWRGFRNLVPLEPRHDYAGDSQPPAES